MCLLEACVGNVERAASIFEFHFFSRRGSPLGYTGHHIVYCLGTHFPLILRFGNMTSLHLKLILPARVNSFCSRSHCQVLWSNNSIIEKKSVNLRKNYHVGCYQNYTTAPEFFLHHSLSNHTPLNLPFCFIGLD